MSRVKSLLFGAQTGVGRRLTARSVSEDGQPASDVQSKIAQREGTYFVDVEAPEPPRVRQSGKPIHTNRWVHDSGNAPLSSPEFENIELVLRDGEIKTVLARPDRQGVAFHDWITVTFDVASFMRVVRLPYVTDDDVAEEVSGLLEKIGLHGISSKREHGRYFQKHCWVIGDNFGEFACGHRSGRAMLSISGQGLLHAAIGAVERLHEILGDVDAAGGDVRLTRVDVAMDFFSNGPSHEDVEKAYFDGKFVRQQKHIECPDVWPQFVTHGCKYTKRGRESGLTDYIGSRNSDLFARRYDKGRAEGDPTSNWVRFEIEIKGRDTIIPLDILLRPQAYFCQYPYLKELVGGVADRMETKRKLAEISVSASSRIIKMQFGKYLRVLRALASSDSDLLDELQHDDPDAWPKRLAKTTPKPFIPIHKMSREYPV